MGVRRIIERIRGVKPYKNKKEDPKSSGPIKVQDGVGIDLKTGDISLENKPGKPDIIVKSGGGGGSGGGRGSPKLNLATGKVEVPTDEGLLEIQNGKSNLTELRKRQQIISSQSNKINQTQNQIQTIPSDIPIGAYVNQPGFQRGFVTETGQFYPTRNESFVPTGFRKGDVEKVTSDGRVTIRDPDASITYNNSAENLLFGGGQSVEPNRVSFKDRFSEAINKDTYGEAFKTLFPSQSGRLKTNLTNVKNVVIDQTYFGSRNKPVVNLLSKQIANNLSSNQKEILLSIPARTSTTSQTPEFKILSTGLSFVPATQFSKLTMTGRATSEVTSLSKSKPSVTLGEISRVSENLYETNAVVLRNVNSQKTATLLKLDIRKVGERTFQIESGKGRTAIIGVNQGVKDEFQFTFSGLSTQEKGARLVNIQKGIRTVKDFNKEIVFRSDIELLGRQVNKGIIDPVGNIQKGSFGSIQRTRGKMTLGISGEIQAYKLLPIVDRTAKLKLVRPIRQAKFKPEDVFFIKEKKYKFTPYEINGQINLGRIEKPSYSDLSSLGLVREKITKSEIDQIKNIVPSSALSAERLSLKSIAKETPSFRFTGGIITENIPSTIKFRTASQIKIQSETTPQTFVKVPTQNVLQTSSTTNIQLKPFSQASLTRSSSRTKTSQGKSFRTTTKQINVQRNAQENLKISQSILKLNQLRINKRMPRMPFPKFPTPKPRPKEEPTFIKFPQIKPQPQSRKSKDLFPVFVRRKGKFNLVGFGETPGQAVGIGKDIVGKSLARSFKVGGFSGKNIFGFKTKREKTGLVFIEPSKRALSTPSEKREIISFKKLNFNRGRRNGIRL